MMSTHRWPRNRLVVMWPGTARLAAGRQFRRPIIPVVNQPDDRPKLAPDDRRHGTPAGYSNHGCRCRACTEAHRVKCAAYMERVRARNQVLGEHGSSAAYASGCRCDECRNAHNETSKLAKRRGRVKQERTSDDRMSYRPDTVSTGNQERHRGATRGDGMNPRLTSQTRHRGQSAPLPTHTVASFFAGIGGFDLGFERAGIDTIWQCEIKEFCNLVLEHHWPGVPRARDIREVQPDEIPEADIWAGGFPCQDISLARMGPRSGLNGKQSGLFFEFARLLEARRPKAVVLENVAGLLSSNDGRDFALVIRTLVDLGYGVAWRVLDSRHFGVPQSRTRVFIVGTLGDPEAAAEVLFEPECGDRDSEKGRSNGKKSVSPFAISVGDPQRGFVKKLAHCLYAESARHTGTDWSRNYVSYPEGDVRRLTPLETERLQGFPDGWTDLPAYAGDIEKLDSARYHACGNAVTVNVTEWLGERLVAVIPKMVERAA